MVSIRLVFAAALVLLTCGGASAQTQCNGQFPAGYMCGNSGSSPLSPKPDALTKFLDQNFGSTQGGLLFRGPAIWQFLNPGTAGQLLQSGGASANPSWTAAVLPTGANPTATAGPAAVNGSSTNFMRADAAPAVQLGSSSQAGLLQCGSGTTCSGGLIAAGSAAGANPTATAGPTAVNGSATSFMRSDAAPAVQLGSATQKGILQVDGSTITASAGVISSAGSTGANPTATAGPNAVNGSSGNFMRADAAPPVQLGSSSQPGLLQCGTNTSCSGGVISTTAVPAGANPTATAGPNAVNGSAATFMRSDAAPAIQLGSASQKGVVEVDGTSITASGGVISAAASVIPPGGRLTVESFAPVQTVDHSAATSLYYDCYLFGNTVPVPVGGVFSSLAIPSCQLGIDFNPAVFLTGAASFTASVAGSTMTVTAVASGTLFKGMKLSCTGCATGMEIIALGSGTGGTGTYTISYGVSAFTGQISGITLLVTAISNSQLWPPNIGDVLTGGSVSAGTKISSFGGFPNTYVVSISQTLGSTNLTGTQTISSTTFTGTGYPAYNVYAVGNSGAKICYSSVPWRTGSYSGLSWSYALNGVTVEQVHDTLGYPTNQTTIQHCWGGISSGFVDYGPLAPDNATHLGAVLATANGQTSMVVRPNATSGGNNTIAGVYNDFNKVSFSVKSQDSAPSWASWSLNNTQPCNFGNSTAGQNERVTFVDALGTNRWTAWSWFGSIVSQSPSAVYALTAEVGLNQTFGGSGGGGGGTALSQPGFAASNANTGAASYGLYNPYPTIGVNYLQCVEGSGNSEPFEDDFMMFWVDIDL